MFPHPRSLSINWLGATFQLWCTQLKSWWDSVWCCWRTMGLLQTDLAKKPSVVFVKLSLWATTEYHTTIFRMLLPCPRYKLAYISYVTIVYQNKLAFVKSIPRKNTFMSWSRAWLTISTTVLTHSLRRNQQSFWSQEKIDPCSLV